MTESLQHPWPTPLNETNGEFWTGDGGQRVRGRLIPKPKRSILTLNGVITDDPRITPPDAGGVTKISRAADRSVAAFSPRLLFGVLDTGEAVSLIDAQNHGGCGLDSLPEFHLPVLVTGAHVPAQQVYSAVRFRLDQPHWTEHLTDGMRAPVPGDGSILSVQYRDGVPWLRYECATPETLSTLSQHVVAGCVVLGRLMWEQPIVPAETEVRIDGGDPWLTVNGWNFTRTIESKIYAALPVPREELTVDRMAAWITLNAQLDGLASAVDELGNGPVQVKAILGTSLIEGYHRRLDNVYDQKKTVTKSPKGGGTPVQKREHKTFRDRVDDVLNEIAAEVPGLIAAVPDLAQALTRTRHDIAHHLVDKSRDNDERFAEWTAVSRACPWLLRAFLLIHAGVDRDAVRQGFSAHNRYQYACANAAYQAGLAGLHPPGGPTP